ncbi:AAA family ATPase [Cypionkella psychrotolerans]|uniref:AAA family ATPase n=1 Tax=Cypionkella psychrotolerans TaxID=1678131 RepID=UPI0006B66EE7|nr:AAA family ATPase [Cypionkella psychrotolerans]
MPLTFEDFSACPAAEDQFEDEPGVFSANAADASDQGSAHLPPGVLNATIRLAETFQNETAFVEHLYRGAVTLIDGFLPDQLEAIVVALSNGLLPTEWSISSIVPERGTLNMAVLVRPEVTDGEVSTYAAKNFRRKLDDALESEAGVLILCPVGTSLDKNLRESLPRSMQLAPLSQDIIVQHLRYSHPAAYFDETALRNILPVDRILATQSYAKLRLALREGSATAVGMRLADISNSDASVGTALRDLAGYGHAKPVAIGIVEDLAAWACGDLKWKDVTRGLLLSGPPGSGKTELARAMAREQGITFVSASYAQWQATGHLGDFLKAMAHSFANAIAGAPSILFIDEIDAFSSRSHDPNGPHASYNAKTIAGLLEHLDGLSGREGVVIIAATNHVDHIDRAIIRSGRFDQHIAISLPDRNDLQLILRQHLGSDLADSNLDHTASLALGATGADIAGAVRNARAKVRQMRRNLTVEDLISELSPPTGLLPPATLWRAAVHEAGHAIVISALGLGKLICLRLSGDGGVCLSESRPMPLTASDFHKRRMADLAGRVAERILLGDVSAGAGGSRDSDLARVTTCLLSEELSYGLGDLGSLYICSDPDPRDFLKLPASTKHRLLLRIEAAEAEAAGILKRNSQLLIDLSKALFNTHLLDGSALQTFVDEVQVLERNDGPPVNAEQPELECVARSAIDF